jgi:hypothetical protein
MIKWTVETRKLSELKPYEKNPRRITEKGLSDLIKSLELFGLAEPIVFNRDDCIVGGQGWPPCPTIVQYISLDAHGRERSRCYAL